MLEAAVEDLSLPGWWLADHRLDPLMGEPRLVAQVSKLKAPASRHEILHKLRQGRMGDVYLAMDTELHRKVALKFVLEEKGPDEREMKDIRDLQEEISSTIVDRLRLKLLKEEKGKILKSPTEDHEAYEYYLKGRYFWYRR